MNAKQIMVELMLDDRFVLHYLDIHRCWKTYYKGPFACHMIDMFNKGFVADEPWNIYMVCREINIHEDAADKIAKSCIVKVPYFEINDIKKRIEFWHKGWGEGDFYLCQDIDDIYMALKRIRKAVVSASVRDYFEIEYIIEARQ